jgi:glycosyltransferase involved in cell wall biosynthesis
MTTRRILICLHDFARGGTERVAIDLARLWTEAGRQVTILCGATEGGLRETVDPRVRVVVLTPQVRRGFLSRLRLGRAMQRQAAALNPDIIFLPGNFHFPLADALGTLRVAIALKISNPPLPEGIAGLFARPVFRHFTRAVAGFAAMNSGLAQAMDAILPGRRIDILYDPVSVRRSAAVSVRRDGVFNILWIGRLERQKDVNLALRTMKALARPAHLTILGEGAQDARTDRQIAVLGLEDKVSRLGHVPDIASHLAGADVLLVTSRYEGGPAVAVEALAHGVPVVSTDCSSMLREVMTIAEAGRIVATRDPGDLAAALAAVCGAPRPQRAALAALVVRFEPERCARAYLDWFDALLRHDA